MQTLAAQSFSKLWHIWTPINHSQDTGISILQSIICNTWAYLDFDQSLQDLGISGLWSIIYKIWAYPDSDQSFARLWHNRISINHSQDSDQSLARLAYATHNGHMFGYAQVLRMIDQSWYAQVLWTIDWSLDMQKSFEWLIGILISPSLANDWSCLNWYAQVLQMINRMRMINRSTDMPMTCDDLLESWYAKVLWTMDQSLDMPKSCEWLIKVRIHLSRTLKKFPCPGWGSI